MIYFWRCPYCSATTEYAQPCERHKEKAPVAGTAGSLIKTNKLYLHDTTKEAKCQDDAS